LTKLIKRLIFPSEIFEEIEAFENLGVLREEAKVIVSLQHGVSAAIVKQRLAELGQWISEEARDEQGRASFVLAPHSTRVRAELILAIPGVSAVSVATSIHPKIEAQGPVVEVDGVRVGGGAPVFFAGPCSVEGEEQIFEIARGASLAGASFLRGGAYKPRTSPYAFQGHGEPALAWMQRAAKEFHLKVVTEVMSEAAVSLVAEHADLLQIGSRNMQNFSLLKETGKTQKPVLLKRGMSATVEEWLLSAEYLLVHGTKGVILCERGIRSFDTTTRNLLDIASVALLSHVYRLPVIVDPSHGVGRKDLILPLGRAALAAGAAGVMIEAHNNPGCALSDGPQALTLEELGQTLQQLGAKK
jgi:3-deoxy-7-phosphoheptulonate synthase